MIMASTLAFQTCFVLRWIALLGEGCAVFLLFGGGYFEWVLFVFPAWVLLVSNNILINNLRSSSRTALRHSECPSGKYASPESRFSFWP
jgi:hypothetical protein